MTPTDPPGKPDNPRRRSLIFKVGQDRFRPPPGLDEVVVVFGNQPIREILFRRFGAKKAMLQGTVLEPKELHGREVSGFYALPRDGTLPSGSRLMVDARTMLRGHVPEGEQLDLVKVFAGRMARVALRRVGSGADTYAVLDRVLERL